jgi:hypothetical protein
MARASEHSHQAKKNEDFLQHVHNLGDFADWGVTILFYIAVHYGRALLAILGTQITSHQHFQTEFLRRTNDTTAYRHFRSLQSAAERSRYDVIPFSWDEADQLQRDHLEPFKASMRQHGVII